MDLLVIRHAIAEDREKFAESGQPDEQRPLTEQGRRRMKRAARGLKSIVDKVDHLATSPLVRAVQTAEIVSDVLRLETAEQVTVLIPGSNPEDFEKWAMAHNEKSVVAIVGHEPHLSSLATWLVAGIGDSRIELKKGGACLISFDGDVKAGAGTLKWLLTPRILRELG